MSSFRFVLLLVACLVVVQPPAATADAPKSPAPRTTSPETIRVAGRSFSEWTSDLKSSVELIRLRAALTLGAFGRKAVPALVESLSDPSPGVRYWAASHLGDLGDTAPEAVAKLKESLRDSNVGVQISAAYALCRAGEVDLALPTLTKALKSNVLGTVLSATDFLGRIGPPAKEAVPALEDAMSSKDYHVKGSARQAIRRIRGEDS